MARALLRQYCEQSTKNKKDRSGILKIHIIVDIKIFTVIVCYAFFFKILFDLYINFIVLFLFELIFESF